MRIDELPIVSAMEDVLIAELDRQYLNGEIAPSSSDDSGYFNAIDGELIGIPEWHAVCAAVYNALKDEGLL